MLSPRRWAASSTFLPRSNLAPTEDFADRVMAAVAAEPSPQPIAALGTAVRGGRLGAALAAIGDSWRVRSGARGRRRFERRRSRWSWSSPSSGSASGPPRSPGWGRCLVRRRLPSPRSSCRRRARRLRRAPRRRQARAQARCLRPPHHPRRRQPTRPNRRRPRSLPRRPNRPMTEAAGTSPGGGGDSGSGSGSGDDRARAAAEGGSETVPKRTGTSSWPDPSTGRKVG